MSQQIDPQPSVALIRPRDPLVLRDARPFSTAPGARAFSVPWPLPRTVAGAARSHIGEEAGLDWSKRADALAARQIIVHGPLMAAQHSPDGQWSVHVPAPRDVVFYRPQENPTGLEAMVLRPQPLDEGEGCDLPRLSQSRSNGQAKALENTALRPLSVSKEVKPETDVPHWWSLEDAARWLNSTNTSSPKQFLPVNGSVNSKGLPVPSGYRESEIDVRMHVSVDPETGTHKEGALFATEGRVFRDIPAQGRAAIGMVCKVSTDLPLTSEEGFLPLGGERRLARVSYASTDVRWPQSSDFYPSDADIELATGLRLQLVTPAIFTHGWLPGWMADGTVPGMGKMKVGLRLVGAAVGRQVPVSGWRLARRNTGQQGEPPQRPGPRATQYAVPAGSVYFFEFSNGKPERDDFRAIWDALWLTPVSDRNIDRDEGFGLVLPGLWTDGSIKENS